MAVSDMSLKIRQIFFVFFALLFVISIPLVLLYTAGWSFNPKKWSFEKTGSMLISTETRDVEMFVNNALVGSGTESRLKNLLPGEYAIKLAKSGYFTWQKKLEVFSEITTFVKNVRLFKAPSPAIISESTENIYPAPAKNKFVYIKKSEKTDGYEIWAASSPSDGHTIANSSSLIKNILWSPNSEKIIAELARGAEVYDLKSGRTDIPFLSGALRVRWDNENNLAIFAEKNDGIYKFDFLFNAPEKIWGPQGQINDFSVSNGLLYTIKQFVLKQEGADEAISVPLERKDYVIKMIMDKKIYLLDEKNQKLQIFDLPLHKLSAPITILNAKDFDILGDNMLFYNDFELWTYNFRTGTKELITRFGKDIKKAAWAGGLDNIVFLLDNQIKIMELDKRDKRQTFDIWETRGATDFFLTKKYELFVLSEETKKIFASEL